MHQLPSSTFLRRLLFADAVVSGVTGVLMSAAATPLATLLALPAPVVRYAGLALLPFAALVLHLAGRERVTRTGVLAVIGLNAAWVAASVLVLLTGWVAPNGLGVAFVLVQALAVAVLAELQYTGLRRAAAAVR